MLTITKPRLQRILSNHIDRAISVENEFADYWLTRPADERLAAIISTVGVMTTVRLTLEMLEFVRYLNAAEVRYLVVGGYALGFHGVPRFTKDFDVWVERTEENAARLAQALQAFRIPLAAEGLTKFLAGSQIPIGRPPNMIDIIGIPDGVTFAECYKARQTVDFEGLKINFISRHHFLQNKLASGRLRDLADIEDLTGETPDLSQKLGL